MFLQGGCTPLHLVLLRSGLSADERLLLMEHLLAAGADTNQTVTDGDTWVCICMLKLYIYFIYLLYKFKCL